MIEDFLEAPEEAFDSVDETSLLIIGQQIRPEEVVWKNQGGEPLSAE
jgi:hypothetical protein